MKKKLALIVGLNYGTSQYQLNGCLNDAKNLKKKLSKKGFDVSMLTEANANIDDWRRISLDMYDQAQPGDSLWRSFSSHGTQLPTNRKEEQDHLDEALCLWNGHKMQLLMDNEVWEMARNKRPGVQDVWFIDACFGGGGARLFSSVAAGQPRFVHYSRLCGNVEQHQELTGENKFVEFEDDKTPWPFLWHSGGREDQTCSDAYIDGKYCGAFTYYFLKAFDAAPPGVTYSNLYKSLLKMIPSYDYPQVPQLMGSFKTARVFS